MRTPSLRPLPGRAAAALAIAVAASAPALADLYRWTDDAGTAHVTDDPRAIPPAWHDRVERIPSEPPAKAAPGPTPAELAKGRERALEEYREEQDAEVEALRARQIQWRERLAKAKAELAEVESTLRATRFTKDKVELRNRRIALQDEIAEAERMLGSVLPREAAALGVRLP